MTALTNDMTERGNKHSTATPAKQQEQHGAERNSPDTTHYCTTVQYRP